MSKDILTLAREAMLPEAWISDTGVLKWSDLERLVALVRADERNSWPAEMEAMERQVNILTDALAKEKEACAKVCDEYDDEYDVHTRQTVEGIALQIRARGQA